jgi:hypothetical protein
VITPLRDGHPSASAFFTISNGMVTTTNKPKAIPARSTKPMILPSMVLKVFRLHKPVLGEA